MAENPGWPGLGHARLDTTQIYTDVAIKALKEVHAQTHPSAGGKSLADPRSSVE